MYSHFHLTHKYEVFYKIRVMCIFIYIFVRVLNDLNCVVFISTKMLGRTWVDGIVGDDATSCLFVKPW